ncbi:HEPN domain-containing protein [Bradyrhizobium sp. USDA 4504]
MNVRNGKDLGVWYGALTIAASRLAQLCREIDMDVVARQFDAFHLQMLDAKYADDPAKLVDRVDGLIAVLERELMEQWFHRVAPIKKPFYGLGLGQEAKQAFKSANEDMIEANTCYALGRNTAAVFHAMRCVEIGLRALVMERRVIFRKGPVAWQQWNELITEAEKAFERDASAITKGPLKDRFLEFYRGSLRSFQGFKDEFRNYVSHTRGSYDERTALRVISDVEVFMNRLATGGLEERGKRIRWR